MREGQSVGYAKTSRTCTQILKVEPALWTFVKVEGVEPTNNSAASGRYGERCCGVVAVLGTQSEGGSRFVERAF